MGASAEDGALLGQQHWIWYNRAVSRTLSTSNGVALTIHSSGLPALSLGKNATVMSTFTCRGLHRVKAVTLVSTGCVLVKLRFEVDILSVEDLTIIHAICSVTLAKSSLEFAMKVDFC